MEPQNWQNSIKDNQTGQKYDRISVNYAVRKRFQCNICELTLWPLSRGRAVRSCLQCPLIGTQIWVQDREHLCAPQDQRTPRPVPSPASSQAVRGHLYPCRPEVFRHSELKCAHKFESDTGPWLRVTQTQTNKAVYFHKFDCLKISFILVISISLHFRYIPANV